MRTRASVKPSKLSAAIGLVVGIVFIGIGLTTVIPMVGEFGVAWLLVAAAITGYNALNLFSEKGVASEVIDFETRPEARGAADADVPRSPEQRLARLDDLRRQGLVTEQEYAEQRKRILDSL